MSNESPGTSGADYAALDELARRIRELRKKADYTQADMTTFGFSPLHWTQIESGRPISVTIPLRTSEAFKRELNHLVGGLTSDDPDLNSSRT